MHVEARLKGLGLALPAPLKAPPGLRLPSGIPVELEAEVEVAG